MSSVRIRANMCVVSDDDDILCWSDIIVMITAGHITALTHGKLELTAHKVQITHITYTEIISTPHWRPSQHPVRVHQMLHKYSLGSDKHRLARGSSCLQVAPFITYSPRRC